MPNQISFEVRFPRQQILDLLADPASDLIVSGTYTFNPGTNPNTWDMETTAEGSFIHLAYPLTRVV